MGANASPTSDTTSPSTDSYRSRSRSEERSPPKEFSTYIPHPQPVQVILHYEVGPLGIHLVPEHNERGKDQGLIVQNVEKGGRTDRNGSLKAGDKIIEINGQSLIGVPFLSAQELFRQGLNCEALRLMVIKHPNNLDQISTVEIVPGLDVDENMVHSEEKSESTMPILTISYASNIQI